MTTTTLINRKSFCKRIRLLSILALLLWGGDCFASNWTLAASPFGFSQTGQKTSTQEKTAYILPQMILEQMGSGESRLPPRSEMLDRKLSSLRTERQSLFLQLSAAIKSRDSLLLQEPDKKQLRKKIDQAEKKISEIQKKIDQNLMDADKSVQQIQDEKNPSVQDKEKSFFQSFAEFWGEKEEKLVADSVPELVRIYGNDSGSLINPGTELLEKGLDSVDFVKYMEKEGVNGYLTGTLSFYGNYFSANVELRIYPDGKSVGQIMEVGALDNIVQVSRNLSQYLKTLVVNTAPVQIYFDITPEEAQKNATIKIDGIVSSLSGNMVAISSGVHTINVESKGFETLTTTFDFKNSSHFFVHVPMSQEQKGQFNIGLKNPVDSEIFAFGQKVGDGLNGGTVTINGAPVIGSLRQRIPGAQTFDEDGNSVIAPDKILSSFFYVPLDLQKDGAFLTVDSKPMDLSQLIDNRRKWAYRGYTALMLTLPVTFFTVGNYQTAVNGYRSGFVDFETAQAWEVARNVSIGLTVAAGGFFIYELIRYLHSASSVLPKTAKEVDREDFYKNYVLETDENQNQQPKEFEADDSDNVGNINVGNIIEEKNQDE